MKSTSRAAAAGKSDGAVSALAFPDRDYTHGFMRRTELTESERAEYKAAWYAAYSETRKAFRLDRSAS